MIILLDGSKGAGKTTTAQLLLKHLVSALYLSIDEIRRAFPAEPEKDIREKNKEAFEIIISRTKEGIGNHLDVIVDCGLSTERTGRFEEISKEEHIPLHKFFLRASYETQLDRVKERDKAKGKESTDVKRFDEIHHHIHSKDLTGFTPLETDKLTSEQIAGHILKTIGK